MRCMSRTWPNTVKPPELLVLLRAVLLSLRLKKNWLVALLGSLPLAMAMVPRTLERRTKSGSLGTVGVLALVIESSVVGFEPLSLNAKPPPWSTNGRPPDLALRWKIVLLYLPSVM